MGVYIKNTCAFPFQKPHKNPNNFCTPQPVATLSVFAACPSFWIPFFVDFVPLGRSSPCQVEQAVIVQNDL